MLGKKMTPAQAEAALQAAAAKNDAKRSDPFLRCPKCESFIYAGEPGCRNLCPR